MQSFIASHNHHFDVVVIGVGSMGSAACYYLAKQGARVLGLEQFSIPNELASHTGYSRLIRKAYYEHPEYVPLLQRAYKNWKDLEIISGEQVYYETGLLYAGKQSHPVMRGVREAASKYNIALEPISDETMEANYAPFHLTADAEKILEPEAGFLLPAKAIEWYTKLAVESGALIKTDTIVTSWKQVDDHVEVRTNTETFYAGKLIITAGPWAKELLPSLNTSLTVTRQMLGWVEVNYPNQFALGKMPCWVMAEEDIPGIYYGFPQLPSHGFDGPVGFKLAHHVAGEITHPDNINREATAADKASLIGIMQRFFPGAFKRLVAIKACMYTNTPDEHFIIDHLPGYDRVVVAAGFSGHGFKFAAAVGEILSELVVKRSSTPEIEFLRATRFED